MLDSSSLGKRHEDFKQYHNKLNATLEGIADEYYGGFNNSILTFSGLYEKISSASNSVNSTKNNLIKAKKMLTEKRDGLDQLYMKSKQLSEIVLLLNRIEEINKLPSEVALNIEKKKFLTAVSQIVQAMQFLFDPELRPIEALAGLRQQKKKDKLSKKERGGSFSYLNSETKWETSDNPETDSFGYIELIIESLLILDKASDAVDVTSFFYCHPLS
ncbi:putative exocyst complex component sec8 [Smittium culicis]|uniref:Exocyst complex component Sec8 n=1 Tax=Smittium culicis TaxID=133412 RepID=A0A1R1YCY6_9FUNG|nr:putative exocyst complex component sec8 [Smittium culicis]